MSRSRFETLDALYADGFPDDSAAYRRWFVDTHAVFAEVLRKNGMPVAAGYLVPRTAVISGREQKVFYLDAFSVLRPFRGKGYAAPLMQKLLERARTEGAAYVLLSPFAPGYYRRYGFADVSFTAEKRIAGGQDFPTHAATPQTLTALYNAVSGNRLLLSEAEARLVLDGYAADGLDVVCIGSSCGAVVGDRFELLCGDERILCCDALRGLKVELPDATGSPRVQARVVNASAALLDARMAVFCGGKEPGGVRDTLLPQNDAVWGEGPTVDAAGLARAVFGHDAYDAVRRNHIFDEV